MIPKDEIGGVKEIKSDVTSIIEDKEKKGEEISLAICVYFFHFNIIFSYFQQKYH